MRLTSTNDTSSARGCICHKIHAYVTANIDYILTSHSLSLEKAYFLSLDDRARMCVCVRERECVTRFVHTWMERRTERASEREMAGICHKILNLQVTQDVIFTSYSASLEKAFFLC